MKLIILLFVALPTLVFGFSTAHSVVKPPSSRSANVIAIPAISLTRFARPTVLLHAKNDKFTRQRREQLGIGEEDDEYDLYQALNVNTDPLISKIIAGSFILAMIALLVVGVIVPSTTDYGEGVCNPILTQGRC